MKELCPKNLNGKAKSYPCIKCKDVFKQNYELIFHNSTEHSPTNEFKCHEDNCNYTFWDEKSFKKHSAGCLGIEISKETSTKVRENESCNKRKTKLIPRLDPSQLVVPDEILQPAPVANVNSVEQQLQPKFDHINLKRGRPKKGHYQLKSKLETVENEVLKETSPKVHEEKMPSQELIIQNKLHQNKSLNDEVIDLTKLFVCQENNCKFAFSSNDVLKKHSELVHGGKKLSDSTVAGPNKRFECKENGCTSAFSSQLQLQYHSSIHERKRSTEQGMEIISLSFQQDQ